MLSIAPGAVSESALVARAHPHGAPVRLSGITGARFGYSLMRTNGDQCMAYSSAQTDRGQQHVQVGEELISELRDYVSREKALGRSAVKAEQLLRNVQATLSRWRACCM